jgi:DnaJ-domain-containing protein 1
LFADIPIEDEDERAFGSLDVLTGWVGHAGPGFAVRATLRVPFDPALHCVELRLRTRGRYVRAASREYGDKAGDLTITMACAPVIHAFVPYAAVPARLHELTVELWLVEVGDPIEERLYSLVLPDHETRRLENALTAVVLALVSISAARVDEGVIASGQLEDALATTFGLDDIGRAWARELVIDAEEESERMTVTRLRAHVSPEAMPRVLGLLRSFARTPRSITFHARIAEALGARTGRKPRATAANAAHYATLGLEPGATREALRVAFHKLAARHHPDRVAEADRDAATEQMKQINAAYAVLRRG